MRINNFGIKVNILILFFLVLSCKKNIHNNTNDSVAFDINKVTVNDAKLVIDKEKKIMIYNYPSKIKGKLIINMNDSCQAKIKIDEKEIDNNSDLIEFVKSEKINLGLGCDGNYEKYTLYISSIPIIKIKDSNIQNFPNIISTDLDLIDNGVVSKHKIKTNFRGAGTLSLSKKSIAIYSDGVFSETLNRKFKINSNINHYVLYASAPDPSLLKDLSGQKLFNSSINNAKHHKIKGIYIDLFINNSYKGIYVLYSALNTKILKNPPTNKRHTIEFAPNNKSVIYRILNSEDNLIENSSNHKFHKENLYTDEMRKLFMKCDKEIENTIDKEYAFAFISTVLMLNAYDNIINNCFVSLEKGTVKEFYKNGFKNDRVYFIIWDLDTSFFGEGAFGELPGFSYVSTFSDDELKSDGSLFACLTNNTNNFRVKYIEYWKNNKNKLKNILVKSLEQQFNHLKSNNAYERELLYWENRPEKKFEIEDFEKIKTWLENRFEYLNKILN